MTKKKELIIKIKSHCPRCYRKEKEKIKNIVKYLIESEGHLEFEGIEESKKGKRIK